MEHLLVAKAKLVFELEGGFEWSGWNGQDELETADNGFKIDGAIVATKSDLEHWIPKVLMGRQYKGLNFDQPGKVVMVDNATITIDNPSEGLAIQGVPVVTRRTRGRFQIDVMPAIDKKPKPPVPDPVTRKMGTWKVLDPGQSLAEAI